MTIELESIHIEDVVLFKNVTIPLNKYPLVVVRGQNLDSRSPKDAANRCGKSLSYSLIPTLLYGTPPTSHKKRDAGTVHEAKSKISLSWKNNDTDYIGTQFAKGKSVGYDLIVNGKAKEHRKGADAQEAIARALPINEKQYYSFVYLNSVKEHPLHTGSAADRFDFFEKCFNLDIYDKIAKELAKEYATLKYEAQKLKELEAEKVLRAADMPKGKLSDLNTRREDLMGKAEKVRKKVDKYLKELNGITAYMTLAEELQGNKLTLKNAKKQLEEDRIDEAAIQKNLKESIAHYAKLESVERNAKRRQKLIKQIAVIKRGPLKNVEVYRERIATLKKYVSDLRVKVSNYAATAEEYRLAKEAIDTIIEDHPRVEKKAYGLSVEKLANQISREIHKIEAWKKANSTLDQHEGVSCPACDQSLSDKQRKAIIAHNKASIEQSETLIKKWCNVSKYLKARSYLNTIKYDKAEHNQTADLLDERVEVLGRMECYLESEIERDRLVAELKDTPKEEVSDKKVTKPETYEDTLQDLRKRIRQTEKFIEQKQRLDKLDSPYESYKAAKERYEQLQAYIDKYQPILERAQTALHRMTVKVTRAESLAEELKRLSAQITKHRDASADFKVYEALRQAYGAKGLRKMRVASIAAAFEQNLNFYAPRIFDEDIKFRIDITSTRFDILAKRNKKREADVRSLSGQELHAYKLLVFLSLLPSIPAHSRCNLAVLDEPDANLDPPSRRLFVSDFLPLLNTLVPNVVVITPRSDKEFNIPNAVTYIVRKKDNFSKIIINDGTPG